LTFPIFLDADLIATEALDEAAGQNGCRDDPTARCYCGKTVEDAAVNSIYPERNASMELMTYATGDTMPLEREYEQAMSRSSQAALPISGATMTSG
jgi:hypothetical protein